MYCLGNGDTISQKRTTHVGYGGESCFSKSCVCVWVYRIVCYFLESGGKWGKCVRNGLSYSSFWSGSGEEGGSYEIV